MKIGWRYLSCSVMSLQNVYIWFRGEISCLLHSINSIYGNEIRHLTFTSMPKSLRSQISDGFYQTRPHYFKIKFVDHFLFGDWISSLSFSSHHSWTQSRSKVSFSLKWRDNPLNWLWCDRHVMLTRLAPKSRTTVSRR